MLRKTTTLAVVIMLHYSGCFAQSISKISTQHTFGENGVIDVIISRKTVLITQKTQNDLEKFNPKFKEHLQKNFQMQIGFFRGVFEPQKNVTGITLLINKKTSLKIPDYLCQDIWNVWDLFPPTAPPNLSVNYINKDSFNFEVYCGDGENSYKVTYILWRDLTFLPWKIKREVRNIDTGVRLS